MTLGGHLARHLTNSQSTIRNSLNSEKCMVFVFSSILSIFAKTLLVAEESSQEYQSSITLDIPQCWQKNSGNTNSVSLKFLHFRTSDQILLFLQVNIWPKNPHHISSNNAKIKVFWFGLFVFYFCGILLLEITFNPSLKVVFIRQVKFYYCQFIEA